jgi:hypothetical protein
MKSKIFTAVIATMILASSCKKEPASSGTETTPPTQTDNKTTASVDGKAFTSVSNSAVANLSNNTFLLTAGDKDDNNIMISGPAQTGTFTNAENNIISGIYTDKNGAVWMSSMSGNVTITITKFDKANKKMSGSFSFSAGALGTSNATGSKTVSSGKFTDVSVIM